MMQNAYIFVAVVASSTIASVSAATYTRYPERGCGSGSGEGSLFLKINGSVDIPKKDRPTTDPNRAFDEKCKTMCTGASLCVGYLYKFQFKEYNCEFYELINPKKIGFYSPGVCYLNKARNDPKQTKPPTPVRITYSGNIIQCILDSFSH